MNETTDVTRTISFGRISKKIKNFTLFLKGHIGIIVI